MVTDFKDYERHWLDTQEWLEYHLLLGVEHFYLYPNNCSDEFLANLRAYEERGVVTLCHLAQKKDNILRFQKIQRQCFNHFLKHHAMKSSWCAIIDDDEFINPKYASTIPQFLQKHGAKDLAQILIDWTMFGTSNIPKLKNHQLLTETLTWVGPYKGKQVMHKTLFRPENVNYLHVHDHQVVTGRTIRMPRNLIQINHYFFRDEHYSKAIRWPRLEDLGYTEGETYEQWMEHHHQREDLSIQRFIPALKQRLVYR